jgi:IS1 family transposase
MSTLDNKRRTQVIAALVEGNSIRATVRMTGVAKNTIVKLLAEVGKICAEYQDGAFQELKCKRLQCDEIWSFVGAKAKNATPEQKADLNYGDVWTWVAMDADTKLVPCWNVGKRDGAAAWEFMTDLASRLRNKVQLTTDGHHAYLEAVEDAFGGDIDYAMLVKIYGKAQEEIRYSPAECVGCEIKVISGNPQKGHISTSYIERQNLTMRMSMRRFTRLTNGFSKKLENHIHAISLHYMYYNFCRIHKTLRCTPAMAAGVSNRLWEIEDIVALLDNEWRKRLASPRGSYKKRISN